MDRVTHGTAVLVPQVVSDQRYTLPPRDQLVRAWSAGFRPNTRRNYKFIIDDWFRFCDAGHLAFTDVRRSHVEMWGAELAETRLNLPSSVAHKLSAVCSFYAWLADEEFIEKNPAASVRRPRVADDVVRPYLSQIELSKCLEASAATDRKGWHRDKALFCLLALNGLRISEALGVNVETIEDQDGHHTLRTMRKGQKVATIPLSVTTYAALMKCVGDRTSGPLFRSETGQRMDRYAATRTLNRICRAAGVTKKITPHSLRRTFITLSLNAHVSLRDVQHSAGHSDPRVTARYDQARSSLDRNATFVLSAHVAS